MRWWSIALAALLPISVAQAAAPAMPGESAAPYRIDITKFQFTPAQLTVPVGAKVIWTNHDEEPHTVTSVGGRFKGSAALDTDDTWSVVFSKPGTYAYFCSVHPFMTATIVVK